MTDLLTIFCYFFWFSETSLFLINSPVDHIDDGPTQQVSDLTRWGCGSSLPSSQKQTIIHLLAFEMLIGHNRPTLKVNNKHFLCPEMYPNWENSLFIYSITRGFFSKPAPPILKPVQLFSPRQFYIVNFKF